MGATFAPITAAENFHSGEDRVINIDVTDPDTNEYVDMTGWSLIWILRESELTPDIVHKTVGGGISIVDVLDADDQPVAGGDNARARILVNSADTVGLVAATRYHHLRREDAGNTYVLSFGPVEMKDANVGE